MHQERQFHELLKGPRALAETFEMCSGLFGGFAETDCRSGLGFRVSVLGLGSRLRGFDHTLVIDESTTSTIGFMI